MTTTLHERGSRDKSQTHTAHKKPNFLKKTLYKGPILDAIAYPGSSPLGP